jgi:hypothetical protein
MPKNVSQENGERYLSLEIKEQFRKVFEETTAIWSKGTEKPFVEVEESNIDTAKDTGDKSRKVCFPNHFPFLLLLETKCVGFEEGLILRIQLFLGCIEEVQ